MVLIGIDPYPYNDYILLRLLGLRHDKVECRVSSKKGGRCETWAMLARALSPRDYWNRFEQEGERPKLRAMFIYEDQNNVVNRGKPKYK